MFENERRLGGFTDHALVGRGTGLFREGFGQVHMMAQLALKKKQAVQVGSGSGVRLRFCFCLSPASLTPNRFGTEFIS